MSVNKNKYFHAYSVGVCYASVCTNLPIEEAVRQMNIGHPTGIDSTWKLSEDKTFAGGDTKNGCACEANHAPNARHYLLNC